MSIQPAQRKGVKGIFGFAGQSGTGKTYTALMFGYGLTGCDGAKLGLLDTENGRGSLYSDILPDGDRYLTMDLKPPFHPRRYIAAIKEFEAAGVEVLVIDSYTHEWDGEGGCSEIAQYGDYTDEQYASGKWGVTECKRAQWQIAKREDKKLVNVMLQCSMQIVVCMRAQEKSKVEPDGSVSSIGIKPICEKKFDFECTTLMLMQDEGMSQKVTRCPADLKPFMGRGDNYIGIQDGLAVREWLAGGKPMTEIDRHRAALMAATDRNAHWATLPKAIQAEFRKDGTVEKMKGATA